MLNNGKQLSRNPDMTPEYSVTPEKRALKLVAIISGGAVAFLGALYVAMALYCSNHFYFGTIINNVNCSGKTVEETVELLSAKANDYNLTLAEREDKSETISSSDIGLKIDATKSVQEIKDSQNPFAWGLHIFKQNTNDTSVDVSYNEDMLTEKLNSLDLFNDELMVAPVDATIEFDENNKQFEIVKENNGTTINKDTVTQAIKDSITNLSTNLNIEETGAYLNANITDSDETLLASKDEMNKYALVTITYQFGDETEIVDKDKIKDWLYLDENNAVNFDKDKVDTFVNYLARNYNTFGITRNFKTSYGGHIVTVVGGDYGWWLNKSKESDTLIEAIKNGEDIVKEPVYIQKAAAYGDDDIGNTYAEVNLGTQHMFFYKDGKLVLESDFVSGKPSNGHATPTGTYSVTYKERNATLKGENYRTPVDYWMPFNLDVGFHDAKWQPTFGGTRYLTNGSHGCINLPVNVAKQLFSYISKGDAVVVYNYVPSGSASTSATTSATNDTTTTKQAVATTQQPATEKTVTEKPVETTTKKQTETASAVNVVIDNNSPVMPELN